MRSRRFIAKWGVAIAIGVVALVVVLVMAFRAAPPPAPSANANGTAYAEERATTTRPNTTAAARPKPAPSPATSAKETIPADDDAPDDVTTGPRPPVVTLTGCLARSNEEFRLKDTTGLNAPQARSWKSGFLTKRSASVSLVSTTGDLALARHVGHRVTVSGTLIDREMRVRTLRRVSSSCDDEKEERITA